MTLAAFSGCDPDRVVVSAGYSTPVYERPPRPYPNYIWVDGDWYVNNGAYVYRQGYWAAPRGHRVWATGTWQAGRGGYYWRRGRWHR